ncbi:glyoxalase/bleomycin resistance protein/dioxygenase [Pantoea sp. BL1]|uniref:VOC family protein n=1 Tax=Pantoea sp. BL1 TaxID=1628190 RepID=UPI0005F7B9AF|nr:VOC family protein [Pantoea sp. BL1]KJV44444.1 glyoxalase/bleomycin resistance protein/dioxygenase [Pantoea sp. BL1]
MIRGIEHIGITVSDLKQAEHFFTGALDASVLYRIVPPAEEDKFVPGKKMAPLNGFPAELRLTGLSMLRLNNGCNVELFQTEPTAKDRSAHPGLPGINHFSVYVDDIYQAAKRMRAHGAEMLEGPSECFAQEEGVGNQTWFGMTPFGVLIELITLPSDIDYDAEATQKRWIPEA